MPNTRRPRAKLNSVGEYTPSALALVWPGSIFQNSASNIFSFNLLAGGTT